MESFLWILGACSLLSAISLVGGLTLVLGESRLHRIILPLVAFSAGSLLGGALFHLLPEAVERMGNGTPVWAAAALGFALFFSLEQFLHWHHCHKPTAEHRRPVTYLILVADTVHNVLDGMTLGAAFLVDTRLGIATWIAAAAHEIPQELGDFGVLLHGGWSKKKALLFNFLSGLACVAGGILVWALARGVDVTVLLPLAAGSFLYIAAADLVPEVNKHESLRVNLLHFLCLTAGLLLLLAVRGFE